MLTPKTEPVQLSSSCNTSSCVYVMLTLNHLAERVLASYFPFSSLLLIFSTLFLSSNVCVLHSLLTADAACALWWFSVLSHCNFKWQTFPLPLFHSHSLSVSLSLSLSVYFLCKMKKITFIFLEIGFTSSKSQRAKLFAVAQVKNATVHRIGNIHRPLPEAHSRRTTPLLMLSLSLPCNIRMQYESF